METTNIQNKLLKLVPKNTKGTEEIFELRQLIVELMRPKLAQLRQILKIRMVPATRDYYHDDAEDWWPDYEIFSDSHAISDMNVSFKKNYYFLISIPNKFPLRLKGLLVLTQDTLKGMPQDMKSIGEKFDYAYSAAKPDTLRIKARKYSLVEELIEDMINFVTNFSRLCTRILEERRSLHDMAAQTRDTGDRIKVKIFDERTFMQLQSRIDSLSTYITEFCALFEARVETKEEAAAAGAQDKLAKLQGPLQSGAVDKAQR